MGSAWGLQEEAATQSTDGYCHMRVGRYQDPQGPGYSACTASPGDGAMLIGPLTACFKAIIYLFDHCVVRMGSFTEDYEAMKV